MRLPKDLPDELDAALWERLGFGTADQWIAFSPEAKAHLNASYRQNILFKSIPEVKDSGWHFYGDERARDV
jgi:hypothetical protein